MPIGPSRYRYAQSMETLVFWGLATVAVVSALLVVGQRHAVSAVLTLVCLLASTAGLFLILSAPFAAIAQVFVHAAALLVVVLPSLWFLGASEQGAKAVALGAASRRAGITLVVMLAAELAWSLRRLRPADMPPVDALPDRGLLVVVQTLLFDYPLALLATIVLVIVAVAGAFQVARREAP